MVINMEEAKLQTLEQIKAFLDGTSEVAFRVPKEDRNPFIERVLKRFGYAPHGRVDRGVLLRYIERMTGLSRQQVTRLVGRYRRDGKLSKQACAPKRGFTYRYTAADVALLAETDKLHSTLSGPATKKLMERAHHVFGDPRYEHLAGISVSHLYNLRGSKPYQSKRRHWTKTNPTGAPIGTRRAPQPNGVPGYIRIDSVHQGDQDGVKGVYHINAVDCVNQPLSACFIALSGMASSFIRRRCSSSPPARRSARPICCPSSSSYWPGFLLTSLDFIRITVRNTSTTKWRRC